MAGSFQSIRSWDGSQDRAFEELCFQLRDPTPSGAELIKTGDPDRGLEWYVRHRNGVEWGWQAKYSFEIDGLLRLMEKSLRTVVAERPDCRRLTFCIPIDLPDAPGGKERKSARQKFEDRKRSWGERISGAERVAIDLVSAGPLLERLSRHPDSRGIGWFFWEQEVFSIPWLKKRLEVTVKAAGERYSPELHVNLPVAFALEGLAASDLYWSRYRDRRGAVLALLTRIDTRDFAGIGVTASVRALRQVGASWQAEVPEYVTVPERLPRRALAEVSQRLEEAAAAAYPDPPPQRKRKATDRQSELDGRRKSLRHELTRLLSALESFSAFLSSPASRAAEHGALLLTGEAGQGKTHLLCDAGERALDADRLAMVLLGGRFSGRHFWSECAEYLGLGQIGGEALLGAMRAAAQASDAPISLYIDALNESQEPSAWREELPALLAELDGDPWISLAVSVRSTFLPLVIPEDGLGERMTRLEHPGFQGRELEATERFFDSFGLEQPRVPLLTPEFTNPLFLKLYCEGLRGLGLAAPPAGEAHITDVFARHLEWKAQRITTKLELDPADRLVERAVEHFSQELASRNSDYLPRAEAAELVNRLAPALHRWPHTLFGQLLGEGLLAADVAWDPGADEPIEVARFVYQRFADYRISGALLDSLESEADLREALRSGEPLRAKLLNAPSGWIEALSVLVPERFGIELLDAANWRFERYRRDRWERALVRSLVSRRPEAMSKRARELASLAGSRSRSMSEEVFQALLTVAPIPSHPLNADFLHGRLLEQELADRDASWGIQTYFAFGDEGPLDRLIRWAARGPYSDCPDEVLRLAGTLMAWTFTSPNRRMRDHATKAMRQLLASRPDVLALLIVQFADVDDPYVVERLAIVAHGSLLTDGERDADRALRLARQLRDHFLLNERTPNVLVRDAVRGCFEWALRQQLIERAEYEAVLPPYGSARPNEPRTQEQLEETYERTRRDSEGNYISSPYASLFFSLFDLGDFGRYVADSKLRRFTSVPLSEPMPKSKGSSTSVPDYPSDIGRRWIFERVLALGWTPERFESFERTYLREDAGRSGHKPERFGKKYQWIALRELLARVADNFHLEPEWSGGGKAYEGPWHFYGRDIDPTLPPPARHRDDEDVVQTGATFAHDEPGVWWDPDGPRYLPTDPFPLDDWASGIDDIPSFESLVVRVDPGGATWVVLQAYFNWRERQRDDGPANRPRREMWSHVYSWLVPSAKAGPLVNHLRRRSFMGRWMPEGGGVTNDAYLAEMPWAAAANEYPREWEPVPGRRSKRERAKFEVYPAWEDYTWEGGSWDCSLEESVRATLPAPLLFEVGGLEWIPGTRSWRTAEGETVALYVSVGGDEHSALLVQEPWLRALLDKGGWGLVIGWLGDKTLFDADWVSGGVVGGTWTEMNGVGSFGVGGFQIASETTTLVSQRTDGSE